MPKYGNFYRIGCNVGHACLISKITMTSTTETMDMLKLKCIFYIGFQSIIQNNGNTFIHKYIQTKQAWSAHNNIHSPFVSLWHKFYLQDEEYYEWLCNQIRTEGPVYCFKQQHNRAQLIQQLNRCTVYCVACWGVLNLKYWSTLKFLKNLS